MDKNTNNKPTGSSEMPFSSLTTATTNLGPNMVTVPYGASNIVWNGVGHTQILPISQWSTIYVPQCPCLNPVKQSIPMSRTLLFEFINGEWHEQQCHIVHPEIGQQNTVNEE